MEINKTNQIQITSQKKTTESANSVDYKLLKASRDLESVFISYVMKAMEKNLTNGMLNESQNNLAGMMFSSVMGQAIAEQGGVGLADMIYQSLLQNKEQSSNIDEIKSLAPLEPLIKMNIMGLENE